MVRVMELVGTWLWRLGTPVALVAIGYFVMVDLGPAWSARFGSGTPGAYTAQYVECADDEVCAWRGEFISDDGRVHRTGVGLGDGGIAIDHKGQTVRAIDTGNRINVYPEGGGWDWLAILFIAVLIVLVGLLWAWSIVWSVDEALTGRRRRRGYG